MHLLIVMFVHLYPSAGTAYMQESTPYYVMLCFNVYSFASGLFMFPSLYAYFLRAVDIYKFEHADGAGQAGDLVIQPFVRFTSMVFFPLFICGGILYAMVTVQTILHTFHVNSFCLSS